MSNPASSTFQGVVYAYLTLPLVHFKGMYVRVKICL